MSNLTAKEMAEKEVKEERFEADKEKYKSKLNQLSTAKEVVTNIEREIEDLDAKISGA